MYPEQLGAVCNGDIPVSILGDNCLLYKPLCPIYPTQLRDIDTIRIGTQKSTSISSSNTGNSKIKSLNDFVTLN